LGNRVRITARRGFIPWRKSSFHGAPKALLPCRVLFPGGPCSIAVVHEMKIYLLLLNRETPVLLSFGFWVSRFRLKVLPERRARPSAVHARNGREASRRSRVRRILSFRSRTLLVVLEEEVQPGHISEFRLAARERPFEAPPDPGGAGVVGLEGGCYQDSLRRKSLGFVGAVSSVASAGALSASRKMRMPPSPSMT
jgi:hypothetical protein